jgi:YD repeat-containing protein
MADRVRILTPENGATQFVARNPTLTVAYNTAGQVASVTENGLVATFTYNLDGTVATQTTGTRTTTFAYDAAGRVTGAI